MFFKETACFSYRNHQSHCKLFQGISKVRHEGCKYPSWSRGDHNKIPIGRKSSHRSFTTMRFLADRSNLTGILMIRIPQRYFLATISWIQKSAVLPWNRQRSCKEVPSSRYWSLIPAWKAFSCKPLTPIHDSIMRAIVLDVDFKQPAIHFPFSRWRSYGLHSMCTFCRSPSE